MKIYRFTWKETRFEDTESNGIQRTITEKKSINVSNIFEAQKALEKIEKNHYVDVTNLKMKVYYDER